MTWADASQAPKRRSIGRIGPRSMTVCAARSRPISAMCPSSDSRFCSNREKTESSVFGSDVKFSFAKATKASPSPSDARQRDAAWSTPRVIRGL